MYDHTHARVNVGVQSHSVQRQVLRLRVPAELAAAELDADGAQRAHNPAQEVTPPGEDDAPVGHDTVG